MMPLDRMPSVSVGVIVPTGTAYNSDHHWRNSAGVLHASVGFEAGGYSHGHLQGEPAALLELAAALIQAAELAEQAADPTAPAVVEGVAG